MEQWASGSFQSEKADETAYANASALGELGVYINLINLEYSQFSDVLGDK